MDRDTIYSKARRPAYETSEHRAKHQAIAEEVAHAWGCAVHYLPQCYPVDWGFYRDNDLAAWVEIKTSRYAFNGRSDSFFSAHKFMFGRQLAQTFNRPFLYVVEYADCRRWFDSLAAKRKIGWAGRTDRGDEQDVEPVVYMLHSGMRLISDNPFSTNQGVLL